MASAFCVLFKTMFVYPKVMRLYCLTLTFCSAATWSLLLCLGWRRYQTSVPPCEYPVAPAPSIHRIALCATFVRDKVLCAIGLLVYLYDSSILLNYYSLLLTLEILIALFLKIILAIPGSLHSYICRVAQG